MSEPKKTRKSVMVVAKKWVTLEVADPRNLSREEQEEAVRLFELGYEPDLEVDGEDFDR